MPSNYPLALIVRFDSYLLRFLDGPTLTFSTTAVLFRLSASFTGMNFPVLASLPRLAVLAIFYNLKFTPPVVLEHHLVHLMAGATTVYVTKVDTLYEYLGLSFPNATDSKDNGQRHVPDNTNCISLSL